VQAWTAVPILPEKLEEFKRVQTRQLEYKSITDPMVAEEGPSGAPLDIPPTPENPTPMPPVMLTSGTPPMNEKPPRR